MQLPAVEQERDRHRQRHHDRDLPPARAEPGHQQVTEQHAEGHPDGHLRDPAQALAVGRTEAHDRGDRGEERRVVAEQVARRSARPRRQRGRTGRSRRTSSAVVSTRVPSDVRLLDQARSRRSSGLASMAAILPERVPLWPAVTSGEDRGSVERISQHGDTDRPDGRRFPARREPLDADARGWPRALQEARRSRAQLRPGPLRADAHVRGDRAALPASPAPLAAHRRPVRVGGGRAVRHRPPLPAQRPAQARPRPRAARALQPPPQHPARLGPAAVGVARHRGPARRPGRDVHQAAPRAGRRRLGHATALGHPLPRSRRAQHAGAVGQA